MNQPLVSIIIPCFNAEQWVAEAIESALHQTWRNREIIVIDDGSRDGSLSVIKSFGNLIRWETGPNEGGCVARNRGLALAKGEWIQFLDADDVLLPECISIKLKHAGDPNVVPCTRPAPMPGFRHEHLPSHWLRDSYSLAEMLEDGPPVTNGPLHRRDHLIRVSGFKAGLPCAQEFELHLRLAIKLGLEFLPLRFDGALTRTAPGSVSRSAGSKMIATIAEVLIESHTLLQQHRATDHGYQDLIAQRVTRIARRLWHLGETEKARTLANKARAISKRWQRRAYQNYSAEIFARMVGFERFEQLRSALKPVQNLRTKD